jgi:hypothetical protein
MMASKTACSKSSRSRLAGTGVVAGSWRLLFTALLLLGALSLAGCRKENPSPQRGWVRVSALAARHPNQAMLADLDRRLAGLDAQRAHLLDDVAGVLPPAEVTEETPALPALAAPATAVTPASPTERIDAQNLTALRRTLTRQAERAFVRTERTLHADADVQLMQARERLRAAADDAGAQAAREDGAAVLALELKQQFALRQAENHLARVTTQQQQDAGAEAQAKSERGYATANPRDKRAKERAAKAEAWAAYTVRRLARMQEDLRAARAHLDAVTRDLTTARARLKARQAAIDAALQRGNDAAVADSARRLREKVAALRDRMAHDIDQQVAKEADRLTEERKSELPAAPPVAVAFPPVPAGTLRLDTSAVHDGVQRGEATARQATAAAVQDIARTMARLRAERSAAERRIREDTRAVAAALAAQRGIILTFDRRDGQDMTPRVRNWLAEYWPR